MSPLLSQKKLQVGDLVSFFSTNEVWRRDYEPRTPGIVIKDGGKVKVTWEEYSYSYTVFWKTGEITNEHGNFLTKIG